METVVVMMSVWTELELHVGNQVVFVRVSYPRRTYGPGIATNGSSSAPLRAYGDTIQAHIGTHEKELLQHTHIKRQYFHCNILIKVPYNCW